MSKKPDKAPVSPSHSTICAGDSLGILIRGSVSRLRAAVATVVASTQHRFCHRELWLVLLCAFQLTAAPAFAQVSKEYQIKAVFLWRLAQFTHWPAEAFDNSESPIFICVLGDNPFGDALNVAVRDETAQGRKLVVQHHRSVEESKMCHILFLAGTAARSAKEITGVLAGRSVLTVKDVDSAPRSYNAMIRFVTEQNKIRLLVNLKAVTAGRLVLDPRLLRAAEITEGE